MAQMLDERRIMARMIAMTTFRDDPDANIDEVVDHLVGIIDMIEDDSNVGRPKTMDSRMDYDS